MNNIRVFISEKFQFLEVEFSICLNRRVFVMNTVFPNGTHSYKDERASIYFFLVSS